MSFFFKKSDFLLASLALITAIGMALGVHQAKAASNTCSETILSNQLSPDKKWKVRLIEGYCESPYTWDTDDVYSVIVTSATDSTKTEWVYQVDVEAHKTSLPVLTWSENHKLGIFALKSRYYEINQLAFSDVPIDITYHGYHRQ